MKNNKITGLLMGLAIIALSIANAVTDYGIKDSQNLNLVVLAAGSSGSSGSSSNSSSSSDDDDDDNYIREEKTTGPIGQWYNASPPAGKMCRSVDTKTVVKCKPNGEEECTAGTWTFKGIQCYEPPKEVLA